MAVQFAKECQFPQDLDAAFLELQEELGDRLINNEALLDATIADIGDLELDSKVDEILDQFENLLKQGDGTSSIKSLDDLASAVGLPKDPGRSDATPAEKAQRAVEEQVQDEQFLFDAGLTVHEGVLYIPGTEGSDVDNIEVLRNIYIAFNKDLDKVASLLDRVVVSGGTGGQTITSLEVDPILVQSKLVLERVPAKVPKKTAFSVEELRVKLSLPNLESKDVVVNDDFSSVVLLKQFLGTDLSKAKILNQFQVEERDLITEVFHINKKQSSTRLINKIRNLGYTLEEVTTIFRIGATGLSNTLLEDLLVAENNKASAIIDQIDFFIKRLLDAIRLSGRRDLNFPKVQIPSTAKLANQNRLNLAIIDLQNDHRKTISSLLFKVAVIKDSAVLTELRTNHTDEQIKILLERRPEIKGIKFNAATAEILSNLRDGLADTEPGSRLVSARAMVRGIPQSIYDSQELLFMWSDLIEAQDDILENPLVSGLLGHLANAKQHLLDFLDRTPRRPDEATQEPVTPYDAQEVVSTPSAILGGRMDFSKTFKIKQIIEALLDLVRQIDLEALAGRAIAAVVNAVADLFRQAIEGCSRLLNKANATIVAFKKRVDAMLSQIFSLTGSGTFDTSMLKCAINFDLGFSGGGVLILISNLLCVLASLLGGFLSKFSAWIADLINKVLCLPLGLINAFLGQVSVNLPAGCQVPTFDLGATITAALLNLKDVGEAKNVVVTFIGKDLFKLKMFINGASDKVDQFSGGADCNGSVNKAYNSAILNIQGGVFI